MRDLGPNPPPERPSAETPIIAARGLSVSAGGQRLLDAVDLDVRPGRRLAILGPNGAGKSLLLRLLHGLIAPERGQVQVLGRPLDRAARAAQAMVFQRPVLLRRSARANIRFALAAKGVPRSERRARADAALAGAGLAHLADRPARLLSGGEQQRLAIARALACAPRMLLMDEPTASLDPAATRAVEEMIHDAHLAGVTVLLVTHDLGQARRIADDAVFLQAGRVAEAGPAVEVLYRPRSAPARAWIAGRLYIDPDPDSEFESGPDHDRKSDPGTGPAPSETDTR